MNVVTAGPTATGRKEARSIKSEGSAGLTFSANGKLLPSGTWRAGSSENVYVYDIASGTGRATFGPFKEPVKTVAMSPDSSGVAAGLNTGGQVPMWAVKAK
jgi:hypothetical protein